MRRIKRSMITTTIRTIEVTDSLFSPFVYMSLSPAIIIKV